MMNPLPGIHTFQRSVFPNWREQFEKLAGGQKPSTLFITCSDSRIVPELLTQTEPGELFVLRNARNLVPPFSAEFGGEAATIEFAVKALDVEQIVVCGHSHCGAVTGALRAGDDDAPDADTARALGELVIAAVDAADEGDRVTVGFFPGDTGPRLVLVVPADRSPAVESHGPWDVDVNRLDEHVVLEVRAAG